MCEQVLKTLSSSEIDSLLNAADNPDAWRTIRDLKNQKEIVRQGLLAGEWACIGGPD